jgi:hypothetical protein
MATKQQTAADAFLQGASRRVDEKEKARLRQEAEKKKQLAKGAKEAAREQKELRKAFPEYYKTVDPLLKTLEKLPADANGDEFHVRADVYIREHWQTRQPEKTIHVWVLYSHEADGSGAGGKSAAHGLSINRKGTAPEERDDISLALNGNKVLKLEYDVDDKAKPYIRSYTYDEQPEYHYSRSRNGYTTSSGWWGTRDVKGDWKDHDSVGGFAAALGAWVQDTAPERLKEIAAALGQDTKPIPTERMTVNRPIRLAPKTP